MSAQEMTPQLPRLNRPSRSCNERRTGAQHSTLNLLNIVHAQVHVILIGGRDASKSISLTPMRRLSSSLLTLAQRSAK